MKKVAILYGTRPEFVKIAAIVLEIQKQVNLEGILVSTGQHREMLTQMEVQFGITPDYNLEIFKPGQSLNEIVARVVTSLDKLFHEIKPDLLIVQGDTSSALAGALAAFHAGIPIAHVEAGLRSFDMANPYPEEGNRKLISQIASLHFAPTEGAFRNLKSEGVLEESISVTGNTVIDALHMSAKWSVIHEEPRIQALVDSGKKFVLVTSHRRENLEHGIYEIRDGIRELSNKYPEIGFVFPMHKNPAIRNPLKTLEGLQNVILCEPLPYSEFVNLMKKAHLILTDSGGVQEEAPTFGVPVLVMRETTERPEAIEAGVAALVGATSKKIVSKTVELIDSDELYSSMSFSANPYGDGLASARIVAKIETFLSARAKKSY